MESRDAANSTAHIYDLYGSRDPELVRLSDLVSAALGIAFEQRFSDEIGLYYQCRSGEWPGEGLKVQSNEIEDEGGSFLLEREFPDYPTLLRVNASPRADVLRHALSHVDGLVFLRRELVDDRHPRIASS